jgi:DNA primase catalytic core
MASRDEIERVKSAVNILDVVTPYVALKQSGTVWKGLCPFHAEKTPSFQVTPEKGFWYCHGCSTGGDVFGFLERAENLTFNEALERLAEKAGIALSGKRESSAEQGRREQIYLALEATARYYQETLSRAPAARQYLLDRGIPNETQISFRLGYAGESSEGLLDHLRKNRVDARIAIEAGVLAKSDRINAAPYDKMRGRIVCPILDIHDRPIAFGGRLMEEVKDRPKYLNTAETPLFSKGRTFFAMSRARKAMAELGYAIVVEGYFDVISAHQAGFTNVVATLGTALTADHADILSRQVKRVILAFDADAAGFRAAQRANAIFEAKEFEVQVLDMPRGEDPDSLLRAGRIAEFRRAIDGAVPIREFRLAALLAVYLSRADLTERDKESVFRREIMPLLRGTKSSIERERYVRMCAPLHPFYSRGGAFAEDQIRQDLNERTTQPDQGRFAAGNPPYGRRSATGRDVRTSVNVPVSTPASGLVSAEKIVLRACLSDDRALRNIVAESGVSSELFVTPEYRNLARTVLSIDGINAILEHKSAEADQIDRNILAELMVDKAEPLNAKVVSDAIALIERREKTERRLEELKARVDRGDQDAYLEYQLSFQRLHARKR